ncbi:hypothetical protein [Mycolicibacterium llatzerense]|uniref:hypothetical protein n=1 Tax=Mycolicibacterium llatzerense TaxID=280871 RepID=UPI0031DD622D
MTEDQRHDSEAAFSMDPVEVLVTMARMIVTQHRFLADAARAYAALPPWVAQTPEGAAVKAQFEHVQQRTAEGFPSTLASLRVALDAYDTFGPGQVTVNEPHEAALWNNKHYVFTQELTVPPPGH